MKKENERGWAQIATVMVTHVLAFNFMVGKQGSTKCIFYCSIGGNCYQTGLINLKIKWRMPIAMTAMFVPPIEYYLNIIVTVE